MGVQVRVIKWKPNLQAALNYRRMGWSIIPTHIRVKGGGCSCRKPNCPNPGKHPLLVSWKPYQLQKPTEAAIRSWWTRWPWAGIAAVCGEVSNGLVVLDIDSTEVARKPAVKDFTGRSESTPRGGGHLFVRETSAKSRVETLTPGVAELKANGSIVTIWPTPGYQLRHGGRPLEVKDARAWAVSLLNEIKVHVQRSQAGNKRSNEGHVVVEGDRNNYLTRRAGQLRRGGLDVATLVIALKAINATECSPPLPDAEVEAIAKSMGRYSTGELDSALPIDVSKAESKWISAKTLVQSTIPGVSWVWRGYLGPGFVTLLSGHPKAGKTTLLFCLLRGLLKSERFLAQPTNLTGKILLFTEEPKTLVKRRLQENDIADDRMLMIFKADVPEWPEVLMQMKKAVLEQHVGVIIIDPLANFWKAQDENDASKVLALFQAIQTLTREYNISVFLLHHFRKSGSGSEEGSGAAHRGSGALLGAVDIGMEVHKKKGCQRLLRTLSRFEETPHESVIEYKDGKYRYCGTKAQAEFEAVAGRVMAELPSPDAKPIAREELAKLLDPSPSSSLLKRVLAELTERGMIACLGKGARKSPFRYRLAAAKAGKSPKKAQERG